MNWKWRNDIISEIRGLSILYGSLFIAFFISSLWDIFNERKTFVEVFWISAGLSLCIIIGIIFVLIVMTRRDE